MPQWIDLHYLDNAPEYDEIPIYKAVDTLTFGELVQHGFIDLDSPEWEYDSYSPEQRTALNKKIVDRFYFREISITPLLRWKTEFMRTLNEIMPKYKLVYAMVENGVSPLQVEDRYTKNRSIYSDFPQTMLSGENQDYATSGNDYESETIVDGSVTLIEDFAARYKDVDVLILDELESLFSPFITMNMNGL